VSQGISQNYQAHCLIVTAHVENASRKTLSETMAAKVLDGNTVLGLNLLKPSVNPLDADNGLLLRQEAMLVRILDVKCFIAILHMLHVIVVELDLPMLLCLVFNHLDNVCSH
jgi:hypothetical protein